jgi:hypothetical protein
MTPRPPVRLAHSALNKSPEREALRQAITIQAKRKTELEECLAASHRTEQQRWDAIRAVEKAEKQIEVAKAEDAAAIAAGQPIGALKKARAALVEAEDHLAAIRDALAMLSEKSASLSDAGSTFQIDRCITEILQSSKAVQDLVRQFKEANARARDLSATVQLLHSLGALGPDLRPKDWSSSEWVAPLPGPTFEQKLKQWVTALQTDADAELTMD